MLPRQQLRRTLARIDGRPYPAYRDLTGAYDYGHFVLHVDHVQPDPFAAPSRLRIVIPADEAGLDAADWRSRERRIALEDWLLRRLAAALERAAGGPPTRSRPAVPTADGDWDEPISPAARDADPLTPRLPAACLHVMQPGQEVLQRSAVVVRGGQVEVRLTCDLPADRRTVAGQRAAAALDVALPAALAAMLPRTEADRASLRAHVELFEDQEALRAELHRRGWVAFVADGSLLPRESGRSDRPLPPGRGVRLVAPEGLAATVRLPHRGEVRGLCIPCGVTLIVGGAYHGKTTLLRALERGVYNHVAGDGRELCVCRATAVSLGAEDGRPVTGVDISAFVRPLPGGVDTRRFHTDAASGSTSQASALVEALEAGADCLLIDEDRSAANFMSRDARMRALVPDDEDPVVPFADRVRALWETAGISTVLVVGGAGAFLSVADRVIRMRDYQPVDVTAEALAVCRRFADDPGARADGPPARLAPDRVPEPGGEAAGVGLAEGEQPASSGAAGARRPPRATDSVAPAAQHAVRAAGGGTPRAAWGAASARVPLPEGFPEAGAQRARARPRGPRAIVFGDRYVDLGALWQLVDAGQVRALADMLPRAAAYADGVRTLAEVVAEVMADVDRAGLDVLSPWPGQCPGDYARPPRTGAGGGPEPPARAAPARRPGANPTRGASAAG